MVDTPFEYSRKGISTTKLWYYFSATYTSATLGVTRLWLALFDFVQQTAKHFLAFLQLYEVV